MTEYPWRQLYKKAIAEGIQPSEYWKMSPDELGLLIEVMQVPEVYSGMGVKDVQALAELRKTGDFL